MLSAASSLAGAFGENETTKEIGKVIDQIDAEKARLQALNIGSLFKVIEISVDASKGESTLDEFEANAKATAERIVKNAKGLLIPAEDLIKPDTDAVEKSTNDAANLINSTLSNTIKPIKLEFDTTDITGGQLTSGLLGQTSALGSLSTGASTARPFAAQAPTPSASLIQPAFGLGSSSQAAGSSLSDPFAQDSPGGIMAMMPSDEQVDGYLESIEKMSSGTEDMSDVIISKSEAIGESFGDMFAGIVLGEQKFGKAMINVTSKIVGKLVAQFTQLAVQKVSIALGMTVANAAATAPTPMAIPAMVGAAIAQFAGAMAGVGMSSLMSGGSSGGGGGGGGSSSGGGGANFGSFNGGTLVDLLSGQQQLPQLDAALLANLATGQGISNDPVRFEAGPLSYELPSGITSFGEGNDPGELGLRQVLDGLTINLGIGQEFNLMEAIVSWTERGDGTPTNRLVTMNDLAEG
jgi:hypothetical protein